MYCIHCGQALPEDACFCLRCGKPCQDEGAVASKTSSASTDRTPGSGKLKTGSLVRAIFSLFGLIVPGVFAIIFTLRAAKAPTAEEEARLLKKAKIMNFIAYGVFILAMIIFIVILFGYVISSIQDLLDDAGFTLTIPSFFGGNL